MAYPEDFPDVLDFQEMPDEEDDYGFPTHNDDRIN
jgi:hypothetical protein